MTSDLKSPGGVDLDAMRSALQDADTVTLLLVLVQFTGDRTWLERARPYIDGPLDYQHRLPEAFADEIRERALLVLSAHLESGDPPPQLPNGELLQDMMSVAAGESVSGDYRDLMFEELKPFAPDEDPRGMAWKSPPAPERLADFEVVVVGAGMSGLCAGVRLKQAGVRFTILEKNATVGGTWYENHYPGCGVDTPNHFYSYSFEPNHDWSHFFAKRDELWRYFEDVADRHDLRRHTEFGVEVIDARWDDSARLWHVRSRDAQGRETNRSCNALLTAVGVLNRPKPPAIPGLDDFAGPAFHTAQWDADFDWRGKRIAMIGTGASGQQVGPTLAPDVEKLTIFQRSPHWVVSNPNYFREVSDGKKWCLANLPFYARWYRFQLFWAFSDGLYTALQGDPDWPEPERSLNEVNERHRKFMERYLRSELQGRDDLIEKALPDYPPYGKRILIDNGWYRMLRRDNVELVTEDIERIVPEGIRTRGGVVHEVDALIFATGFYAERMLWPMRIEGRDGLDLARVWPEQDAKAYLGATVPGFPNLFILMGPNTGLAHGGNQIFMTECQVRYVMRALRILLEQGHQSMEVRESVYENYNAEVDSMHERMVWTHPGVTNWYRNDAGRVFAISPWRLVDFWRMTSDLDPSDYVFDGAETRASTG